MRLKVAVTLAIVLDASLASARDDLLGTRHAIRVGSTWGMLDYVLIGVCYSRLLTPGVAVDARVTGGGVGRNYAGALSDASIRIGNFDPGHIFSMGLGASLLLAERFGAVTFGQAEAAYEYRPVRGFNLFVGLGPTLALNGSAHAPCTSDASFGCLLAREQFQRGDLGLRLRIEIGASF
jgi:hypothetical protein